MGEERIGVVAGYDAAGQAARLRLSATLQVGDRIHIVGQAQDIEEVVTALALGDASVEVGQPGQQVGVWCPEQVRAGDEVYRVA